MGINRPRPGRALPRCVTFGLPALALVLVVAAPPALRAQSPALPPPARSTKPKPAAPDAALPSARSIVDRHVAAIGGKEALLSHSSSKATGTFTMAAAGMSGGLEIFAAKPDKSVIRINLPGVGEIIEGYDGKNGWSITPMTGPMLLEGKQLADKKFDMDFYGELHDDSRYQSMTTVERTEFDGRPCYKVRLVRKEGGEDFEFFDVETGLRAGRIATRETPMGAFTSTAIETDYKKFGNLLLSSTIKVSMMGTQQVLSIQTVEYDNVAPSVFDPPAEIKALIK